MPLEREEAPGDSGLCLALGVLLEPSVTCCACYLGLAFRRITAVDLPSHPKHLQHALSSVPCAAVLVDRKRVAALEKDPAYAAMQGRDEAKAKAGVGKGSERGGTSDGVSDTPASQGQRGTATHYNPDAVVIDELFGARVFRIDELALDARDASGALLRFTPPDRIAPPPPAASLGDIGFVGWTSGSTGTPKAMGVTAFRIAHWSRWRTFHTPACEFGTRAAMNLFWAWYWHIPLTQGRTLCITPSEANTDVIALVRHLEVLQADYVDCLTPGQLQLITEICDELPPTLRHVFSSGEALPLATARHFLTKFPRVALHNVLSTTETAADICMQLHLSRDLCDELAASGFTHLPVMDAAASASLVWNNTVDLEPDTGRLIWRGWNVEAGYLVGGDSAGFNPDGTSLPAIGAHPNVFVSNDRATWDGTRLMVVGRSDSVIKVRGFRVDLSGAEAQLLQCKQLTDGSIVAYEDSLWACVVTSDVTAIEKFVAATFEPATRPVVVLLDAIPYTGTGKRDRVKLKEMLSQRLAQRAALRAGRGMWSSAQTRRDATTDSSANAADAISASSTNSQTTTTVTREGRATAPNAPQSSTSYLTGAAELAVLETMRSVLGFALGQQDDFFASGGTSLKAMRLAVVLGLPIAEVFAAPTAQALAQLLLKRRSSDVERPSEPPPMPAPAATAPEPSSAGTAISIAGMSVHLPGAVDSLSALWQRMHTALDLLDTLPDPDGRGEPFMHRKGILSANGLPSMRVLRALGLHADAAARLGAEQRVMLELAVSALQDAGIDAAAHRTGVFVSSSSLHHPKQDLDTVRTETPDVYFAEEVAHDKDYVATAVAYHLGLTGPAEAVQTACSSSLVAIVRGVHALRLGLCEVAICGGVSLSPDLPLRKIDGMIWSPHGVCKPFSDEASGTVPADGGGVVILTTAPCPRQCYAAIRGVGVNNDGKRKSAFSQPSHEGQVEVVNMALADAQLTGADVDYVECHGTGTKVGDPIELHALAEVHAGRPSSRRPLLVGSIKGHIGHMNTASGVASFIKSALCVFHGEVPPSLHSEQPTSLVDWNATAIRVAQREHGEIACAGVSSFGIGGTNAHVVLSAYSPSPRSTEDIKKPVPIARPRDRPLESALEAATIKASSPEDKPPEALEARFMYEEYFEATGVAPAHVPKLPVVLLQDGKPSIDMLTSLHLQTHYYIVDGSTAVTAARAHGALGIVSGDGGTGESSASVEALIWRLMQLLLEVSGSMAKMCDVFVFLPPGPQYAACRAVLRTSRKELPNLSIRDLTVLSGPSPLPALPVDARIVDGQLMERRLRRIQPSQLVRSSDPAPGGKRAPADTALVTGGLRGVGLRVGAYLLDEGRARRVVLVGRTAPRPADRAFVESLVSRGAEVVLCDVSEWNSVASLPDASLIIHCAGAVDDQLMKQVTAARLSAVLKPKVAGARHLQRRYGATARVLAFSSTSALLGVAGQATYAAANAYLDELFKGDVVQWGGIGEVGMAVDLHIAPLNGERFIPVAAALRAVGTVLDASRSSPTAVLDCDWPRYSTNASVFAEQQTPLFAVLMYDTVPLHPVVGSHQRCGPLHVFSLVLGLSTGPWAIVREHVVGGAVVMPATAYVAWTAAALDFLSSATNGHAAVSFSDCNFTRMLDLSSPQSCSLTLSPTSTSSVEERGFATITCDERVHATMAYSVLRTSSLGGQPAARPGSNFRPVKQPYAALLAQGYCYGPAFARLEHVQTDGRCARADLKRYEGCEKTMPCCPAAFDAALQLASFLDVHGTGTPVSIDGFEYSRGSIGPVSIASSVATAAADSLGGADVDLFDAAGALVGRVRGLRMVAAVPATSRFVYSSVSTIREETPSPTSSEAGCICIGADAEMPAGLLLRMLRARMQSMPTCARITCCQRGAMPLLPGDVGAELAAAAAHDTGATVLDDLSHRLRHSLMSFAPPDDAGASLVLAEAPFVVHTEAGTGKCWFEQSHRLPCLGPSDVEIQTSHWALNFRDVLVAKGILPDVVGDQSMGIGGECYGTVTRTGSAVRSVRPGSVVLAFPPGGMGSVVVVDEQWVLAQSSALAAVPAVSGTMAYATAWLALHLQARVQAGMVVLIHSAAGGVGLAALALCVRAGCRVLATASTEEKRRVLIERGAAAAFNSRSPPDFAAGVRAATGGAGVDVVLNSLSGNALTTSLQLLKPFGHFVEIGKRDSFEGAQISYAPLLQAITISAAHIDVLMLERPEAARGLLKEVSQELSSLPALPTTEFPMRQLNDALDYMSSGTHIGKIIVTASPVSAVAALPRADVSLAHHDPLAMSVAAALGVYQGRACAGSDGSGRCVVLADFPIGMDDAALETALRGAACIITRSRLVARLAVLRLGVPLAIEIACPWAPLAPSLVREAVALHGHGHVIASSASASASDTASEDWLPLLIAEAVGGSVQMDVPFADHGLDSLLLITLASRISAQLTRKVSADDLERLGTLRALQEELKCDVSTRSQPLEIAADGQLPPANPSVHVARPRILCLHGFRSCGEVLRVQLRWLLSAFHDAAEFIFADAQTLSTGAQDPTIPDSVATYEWYGVPGDFASGWKSEADLRALNAAVDALQANGPYDGVIGFSQGSFVATCVDARWAILFSAITAPPGREMKRSTRPTLHAFDEREAFAHMCRQVVCDAAPPGATQTLTHSAGHQVPHDPPNVQAVVEFVRQHLALSGKE